jgi:hypothetical protein
MLRRRFFRGSGTAKTTAPARVTFSANSKLPEISMDLTSADEVCDFLCSGIGRTVLYLAGSVKKSIKYCKRFKSTSDGKDSAISVISSRSITAISLMCKGDSS